MASRSAGRLKKTQESKQASKQANLSQPPMSRPSWRVFARTPTRPRNLSAAFSCIKGKRLSEHPIRYYNRIYCSRKSQTSLHSGFQSAYSRRVAQSEELFGYTSRVVLIKEKTKKTKRKRFERSLWLKAVNLRRRLHQQILWIHQAKECK